MRVNVQVADDMFQDFQDSKEMKKMAVKEIEQLVGRSGSQEMSGGRWRKHSLQHGWKITLHISTLLDNARHLTITLSKRIWSEPELLHGVTMHDYTFCIQLRIPMLSQHFPTFPNISQHFPTFPNISQHNTKENKE